MSKQRITIYADGLLYAIQYDKQNAISIFQRELYNVQSELNMYCDDQLVAHWNNSNGNGHSENGWSY